MGEVWSGDSVGGARLWGVPAAGSMPSRSATASSDDWQYIALTTSTSNLNLSHIRFILNVEGWKISDCCSSCECLARSLGFLCEVSQSPPCKEFATNCFSVLWEMLLCIFGALFCLFFLSLIASRYFYLITTRKVYCTTKFYMFTHC